MQACSRCTQAYPQAASAPGLYDSLERFFAIFFYFFIIGFLYIPFGDHGEQHNLCCRKRGEMGSQRRTGFRGEGGG
eukprot:9090385-Pyramimonas_sp.AAC.1